MKIYGRSRVLLELVYQMITNPWLDKNRPEYRGINLKCEIVEMRGMFQNV